MLEIKLEGLTADCQQGIVTPQAYIKMVEVYIRDQ
jgi:hypothetical protein